MDGYGADAGAGKDAEQAGGNVMCDDRIVIVGFGGHGKSVADAILRQGKYSLPGINDMFLRKHM